MTHDIAPFYLFRDKKEGEKCGFEQGKAGKKESCGDGKRG